MHATIEMEDGEKITPFRVYRIRGGYRLLVTAERDVWQEFEGRYLKLATRQDWRCPYDDTINRQNVCEAANFWGYHAN